MKPLSCLAYVGFCCCLLTAVLTPSYAMTLTEAPSITLEENDPSALQVVRVRVFPHKRNFPPQYRDTNFSTFGIESSAPCTIYEADEHGGRSSRVLTKVARMSFQAHLLRGVVWVSCPEPVQLKRAGDLPSYSYVGDIQIKPVRIRSRLALQAVVYLPVEEYLKGVVPSEVKASWPMETLKSQAVAARTYTVYHMAYSRRYSQHPDFDVDDSVVFQAFTGIDFEHRRTNEAIKQTSGQIVMFKDQVIQAYYHADSGGVTESAAMAFKMDIPYCQHRQEPYALHLVNSQWRLQLSARDIAAKLGEMGFIRSGLGIDKLILRPEYKSKSGRVTGIDVKLSDGQLQFIPINKLKRSINLSSSLFSIASSEEAGKKTYTFEGKGSGHGVGLNQMGAKVLANHYQWSYDRILKFYYANTHLCSLSPMSEGVLSCMQPVADAGQNDV